MGEKRVRIIDVSRATGISRNMLSKLYYDRAQRVDLDDIAKLCDYLECSVADLFEILRYVSGLAESERSRMPR
jgi:putative transcriptional regulator